MHCFSCGFHKFPKNYIPSGNKEEKINAAVLPIDFTREVPSYALKWLLQFGLPFTYWRPFIGWSESHSRLVFTVGTGPSFSVGRFIKGEGRSCFGYKTQSKGERKWFVWGESHKAAHVFGNPQTSEQIVLVEDLISAHKVGNVSATICLFGTNIFSACIPVLRHYSLPIVLWLDKDQEETMPKKARWLQIVTGLPVRYIVTKNDPKLLTLGKIYETL
jgi:hypothetical protein